MDIYKYMSFCQVFVIFVLSSVTVASEIPMLVYDGPFLDQIPRSSLMEMFLWTVRSFYGFGEQMGSDLFFTSHIPLS